MRVAILGASQKPERYSNKALHKLVENGHEVFPVHPALESIDGHPVYSSLSQLQNIDTLTVYVGPEISSQRAEEMIALKPRRIIFNPGTENPDLQQRLSAVGIPTLEACTLVLLSTHQF